MVNYLFFSKYLFVVSLSKQLKNSIVMFPPIHRRLSANHFPLLSSSIVILMLSNMESVHRLFKLNDNHQVRINSKSLFTAFGMPHIAYRISHAHICCESKLSEKRKPFLPFGYDFTFTESLRFERH